MDVPRGKFIKLKEKREEEDDDVCDYSVTRNGVFLWFWGWMVVGRPRDW